MISKNILSSKGKNPYFEIQSTVKKKPTGWTRERDRESTKMKSKIDDKDETGKQIK